MGAVNSCCIPRRTFEECRENHASTPRRLTRRNLSATFQWPGGEDEAGEAGAGLLNINTATEEELMTLPGVNRLTAQHIIEYRRQIGGFKKVEDLALVSGVGATRLTQMRGEICVSNKQRAANGSHTSSPMGSRQDLSLPVPREKQRRPNGVPVLRVNVNTANVFQLMRVKGLGHNLAENVVAHRDKKGPFRSLDDLVKVKGVSNSVLSSIRHQLTLEGETVSEVSPSGNSSRPPSQYSSHALTNGGVPGMTPPTATSPPSNPPLTLVTPPLNGFNSWHSVENILEYLGPAAASQCKRKPVKKFDFRHDGRKAFRVATWNLQKFSVEKASNRDVQDVVCMTILENGFGIVAIQELTDEQSLQKICDELNEPSLPHVREWKGRRGRWRCVVSDTAGKLDQGGEEHHGFLYDSSQGLELLGSSLLEQRKSAPAPFDSRPFLGTFRVRGEMDCVVVSVHLQARKTEEAADRREKSEMAAILDAVEDHVTGEREIIILGDFNQPPDSDDLHVLQERGYHNCLMPWVFTDISCSNSAGTLSLDNIWLSRHALRSYTDHAAVVREGLSSPFIPNGWTLGGVVSDHCPVFAELFADLDSDSGDIGRGVDNIVFTVGAGS